MAESSMMALSLNALRMRSATSPGMGSLERARLLSMPRTPSTRETACSAAWRWKWWRTWPVNVTYPSTTSAVTAPLGTNLSASRSSAHAVATWASGDGVADQAHHQLIVD